MRTSATISHVLPLSEHGSGRGTTGSTWFGLTGIIGCWATKMREKSPTALSEEGKNNRTRNVSSSQTMEGWTCLTVQGVLWRCLQHWQCRWSSLQHWGITHLQGSCCGVDGATFCPIPCTALACSRTFHLLKELVLVIPTVPLLPDKQFRKEVPWDCSRGQCWCSYKAVTEVRFL